MSNKRKAGRPVIRKIPNQTARIIVPKERIIEKYEIETFLRMTKFGFDVEVLQARYMPNMRTPDSLWNNEYWEVKSVAATGKNSVANALKNAKGQSSRIILDLSKSKAPINKYIGGVMREMKRKKSIQIIIIFRQKEYCLLTRDML